MPFHSLMLLAAVGSGVFVSGSGDGRFVADGNARAGSGSEHRATFHAECDAHNIPTRFQVTIALQESDVLSVRSDADANGRAASENAIVRLAWTSADMAGTHLTIAADGAPRTARQAGDLIDQSSEPVYAYVSTEANDANSLASVFTAMGSEATTLTWERLSAFNAQEPLTARFELTAQVAGILHDVAMGCRKLDLPPVE